MVKPKDIIAFMKLIAGLGNPGEKHLNTRHNLGFLVLDEYRRKKDAGEWSTEEKFKAEVTKVGNELMLVRPLTFMNNSGLAISKMAKYFKVKPEDIIIVHDELDLLLGKIKLRLGGGFAGHHGVESIINSLGTDKFIRFRLGIGTTEGFLGEHKRTSFNAEHFVMEPFMQKESSKVKHMIKQTIKGLDILLEEGIKKAQNQFN